MSYFEPREYQRHITDWVMSKPFSAVWVPPGLGKTASTLDAYDRLVDMVEAARGLIVAPKRVSEHTWPAECDKWEQFSAFKPYVITAADLPTKVVNGKRVCVMTREQKRQLLDKALLHAVHYDLVPRLVQAFHGAWPWDFVVLDEASMVKSRDTQRFKALKKVRSQIDRIVELTGTPSPNGIEQLWSQIYLLDGGERLGKTLTQFRERYMRPGARRGNQVFDWVPRPGAREEVYAAVSDIVISLRAEDWLELPERVINIIPVELTGSARSLYRKLEREFIIQAGDRVVEASTGAALGNKLMQLANGAVYSSEEGGEAREVVRVHDAKLDALEELAEASETLLVAYWFKHDLARLQERFPYAVTLGDDPKVIDRWNAGKIKMLLTHPMSAGHGLNLQDGGSEAVWFSLTWDLELYQQWCARLHRSGQTADRVVIHHLVASGTIDEDVLGALEGKAGEQDALLYAVSQRLNSLSYSQRTPAPSSPMPDKTA